jgi:hypothetical protein
MPATVTVVCKWSPGLDLRLFKMEDHSEPVMGGGTKTVQRAVPIGNRVKINGYAVPFGKAPTVPVISGFAVTPNVDAELFAEWMKQNADSDLVKNGLIFAHEKSGTAEGHARAHEKLKSGLEPIDPQHLPKGIQAGDRKAA